jgi:copper homeostasis protein CutC
MTATPPAFDFNNLDMEAVKQVIEDSNNNNTTFNNISESVPELPTVQKTLSEIHTKAKSTNKAETFASLAELLQKGATSPKMSDNASSKIGGTTIQKGLIVNACKNNKITPRQLARALGSNIAIIAETYGWQGNQAKNFTLEYPDATESELAWASDFQTFNNECPERVRRWLVKNFQDRFKTPTPSA